MSDFKRYNIKIQKDKKEWWAFATRQSLQRCRAFIQNHKDKNKDKNYDFMYVVVA